MTQNTLLQELGYGHKINWWKTPAESPDLNPIENLWHELKEYLRREIKPKTKQQLLNGIVEFWDTVDIAKCKKYIGHLKKVVPKVILIKEVQLGTKNHCCSLFYNRNDNYYCLKIHVEINVINDGDIIENTMLQPLPIN